MKNSFAKNIINRLDLYNISYNNIYMIYDDESELSNKLSNDVIARFNNVKILKIEKNRRLKNINKKEIDFINWINGICFIFLSNKWFNFKSYNWWKKLRDFLISKNIFTFEIWRLKYFNTKILQNNLLLSLNESISIDTEEKWLIFENAFNKAVNISINDKLFYKWPYEKLKYNFWLYKWKKNTIKWSLYPVWEVLSELKNLDNINWKVKIYAFPNINNEMIYLEKSSYVYIKKWKLYKHDLWKEFDSVLNKIKLLEPDNCGIIIREMWFSINKNIKKEFKFPEISSAEKMYGFHISLWWKYWVYNSLNKVINQNIHVDILVDLDTILFDNNIIYRKWKYYFD